MKGDHMLFVLILAAFSHLPYNYTADSCSFYSSELCCVWSYDICDIQPSAEELAADPRLNKISELWCFSPFRFTWEEDPEGPYPTDDQDAFLQHASPEEKAFAEKIWAD